MKTEHHQLTLFLPDHDDQPALVLLAPAPHPTPPAPDALSVRDAAHLYGRRIKDMPVAEQPTSRLQHYGAGALSTGELVASCWARRPWPTPTTSAARLRG